CRNRPACMGTRISALSNSAAAAYHVEQKTGCRILHIGVEALGHRYEMDVVVLQGPDGVQAVHQGPPEPIQLPDQRRSNFRARALAMSRLSAGRLDFAPLITSS